MIKVALNLKMERRMIVHVIKDVLNVQDGKAQEGMEELETSLEGLNFSL